MKPFASRILALSVLAASIVSFAEDNVQYWFDAQVEAHLTDKIKFKGEEELWYDDDRFFLQETIFLLEADVCDWLAVGVGDRFVDHKERKNGKMQWIYEHRPTLDITFKHSIEGFRFDFRNRFEYRDKEGADKNYLRYRGRMRVRTPWEWTDWKISPYSSWEMYIEDKPSLAKGEMFNKSRVITGLSMKPAKYTTLSLFYLLLHERHDSGGWNPIHVPGLEIKFEF
jgi:hypothetical protein